MRRPVRQQAKCHVILAGKVYQLTPKLARFRVGHTVSCKVSATKSPKNLCFLELAPDRNAERADVATAVEGP
jgi:hypothetical protein